MNNTTRQEWIDKEANEIINRAVDGTIFGNKVTRENINALIVAAYFTGSIDGANGVFNGVFGTRETETRRDIMKVVTNALGLRPRNEGVTNESTRQGSPFIELNDPADFITDGGSTSMRVVTDTTPDEIVTYAPGVWDSIELKNLTLDEV